MNEFERGVQSSSFNLKSSCKNPQIFNAQKLQFFQKWIVQGKSDLRIIWKNSKKKCPTLCSLLVSTVRAVTQTHTLLWLLCTENLIHNHIYNIPELKPICRPETRGASEPRAVPSRSEYKDMDARFSYPTTILQYNTPSAAWASKTLMCLCYIICG